MKVTAFAEIEQEFIERVHRMVWCNVATVDAQHHPHSRVLHPIWEGNVGWIATGRHSIKAKHLENNPYVSLAYIAEVFTPVYVEGTAQWVDDTAAKIRIWNLLKTAPPPLGYDPTPFFGSVDNPSYGLLKIMPQRIELAHLGGANKVWRQEA